MRIGGNVSPLIHSLAGGGTWQRVEGSEAPTSTTLPGAVTSRSQIGRPAGMLAMKRFVAHVRKAKRQ
jgi:hypothetical protein